jgi:hypothetical protein
MSQSASTQVGVNCPRVCLKGLPDGVDCLIIRFALNCWKYRVREDRYDVFDSCILHLDVLGGLECLCALLLEACLDRGTKETQVFVEGYSLGY